MTASLPEGPPAMRYRVIDLVYSPRRGRIDDEPLQRVLNGQRVLSVREHVYVHDGVPHLLLGVAYELARPDVPYATHADGDANRCDTTPSAAPPGSQGAPEAVDPRPARGRSREDWRQILRDEAWPLFETLRAWRAERARADGVPPYVLLTNAQLARVANERPASLKALGDVRGLGKGRLDRFGRELLELLATGVLPEHDPPAARHAARAPATHEPGGDPAAATPNGSASDGPGDGS